MVAAVEDATEVNIRVVDLAGHFSPAAHERIQKYTQSFVSFEPVLGLLYSDVSGRGSWSLAAFGQATVDEMASMYSKFGAVVCYEIDGIRFIIPQIAHIEELDSGVFDFVGDRIHRRVPDES